MTVPRSTALARAQVHPDNGPNSRTADLINDATGASTTTPLILVPNRTSSNVAEHLDTSNRSEATTSASQYGHEDVRRPLLPEQKPVLSSSTGLVALQEWEGYVIEIGEDAFVSRLWDITAGAKREEEEATIPFDEISDEDRRKMRLGSIFRWVIGYQRSVSGTKRRVSEIVFRDLPVVTQADWDEAEKWAIETRRLLGL